MAERRDEPGDRGGLSSARRYTPRGRSMRDLAEGQRSGRGDPFRPALEVVDGGERRTARTARTARTTRLAAVPSQAEASQTSQKPRRPARQRPARQPGRVVKPRPKPRRRPPAKAARLGEPRRRLRVATILVFALFLTIAGRLVQIQVTDAKAYADQGLRDRLKTVELPAARGSIYDRDGAVLVYSVDARYISADPTRVEDPETTATQLFEVLGQVGVTRSDILSKITPHQREDGTEASFEYLARGVDITIGEQVEALDLAGIDIGHDKRRDVPNHDLAANILGFTRASDQTGLAGIEAGYDSVLRGIDGEKTYEVGGSNLAQEIPGGYSEIVEAQPGSSITLTIDRDLQHTAQSILTEQAETVDATFACAIVMDTETGEVLAQASYPTYDAANPFDTAAEQRKDACTEVVYEPGSVHKALVVGAALEEGIVSADTAVIVGPSATRGGTTYTDHVVQAEGTAMTLPGILALSSNVGTIAIADQLGKEDLYAYQQDFGLGTATNEGLPNESSGAVLAPEDWTGSSYGSIPIGDGVSVTALQMTAAYAAIANDGVWIQPHLVRSITSADGVEQELDEPTTRQVLSPEHATELRTMLEAVTTLDDATGTSAAIEGYRVAGKTGTGLYPEDGGYAEGNVASFIGIAPADSPRYVVSVVAYAPSGTGGSICAPVFHDLMSFVLGKYQVQPTGTTAPTFTVYP